MTHHLVSLRSFRDVIRDGDEHGWAVEYARLWMEQKPYMDQLRESIEREGIRRPILVGSDGRVWDGHHRVCVAISLDMDQIPITFSGEDEDE
jgi:hypothetical protein